MMKRFLFYLVCFLFLMPLFGLAQQANWIENISTEVGIDTAKASYVYVTDVNNDDYPDLIFVYANLNKGQVSLYMNVQKPGSSDPTERYFVDTTAWSMLDLKRNGEHGRIVDNIAFADVDNDGDVDAITSIYYHRWEYYHPDSLDPGDRTELMLNRGNGRFDLFEGSGLNKIGPHSGHDEGLVNIGGISFLDYNKDGNIDLFLASWFDDYKKNLDNGGSNGMTSSYLLKGNGDGTFTDESFWGKIKTNVFPLYGSNVTDWNNDGWMDIATAPYCRSSGSLWANDGSGRFTDVASQVGFNTQKLNGDGGQHLCTWATQPADYDNDGDMDFYYVLVHGGFANGEGRSTLVINKGASENYSLDWALDKIHRDPPRPSHIGDYDAAWFDFDNDMRLDIVSGSGGYAYNRRLFFLLQDSDNEMQDISSELEIIYPDDQYKEISSIQPIDFDLDGDDDILIAHGDGTFTPKNTVTLIENKIGQNNNWVGIKLFSPAGSNLSGIGNRITVWAGGVQQTREIKAGFGHFAGQQPFITNFGLGTNNKIDSVVVRWQTNPTTYTKVTDIPINQISIVNENGLWGNLAINEKHFSSMQLFPNPAKDYLVVKFDQLVENAQFSIVDVSGKQHYFKQFDNSIGYMIKLDISNLANGYYILKFEDQSSQQTSMAFIINK
ncbi:MAG: T9SS type A sorting domain-containing protein [Bacteroidetes bacterium]|nr:T9SS type A sorting domain-containing protein [Bacteroidota bacterium]MBT5528934.1 T9SS type A sorting domain-containing protein [Cytophagia bacterium]